MKIKGYFRAFWILFYPLFSFIALKIIDNVMGEGIPLIEYIIVCSIVILLLGLTYFVFCFVFVIIDEKLDNKYNQTDGSLSEKCKYGEFLCCAKLALETIQGDYDLNLAPQIASQYNLYTEDQIIEIESSFEKGEIWIFSYDLTTEVLEDIASKTVKINLEKGIVYREFYIADTTGTYGNAAFNRKRMEKWYGQSRRLKDRNKDCLAFYPYNSPNSILNYMFALFGIVLYIKYSENQETMDIDNIDAFFSLRSSNSSVKKPIYVKMSHCMTIKYFNILDEIIKNENNRKRHNRKKH